MSPNPFGKLRDAFSRGAELSAGVGVFYNWTKDALGEMLSRRFGLDDPTDQGELITFAESGVAASAGIGALSPDELIDLISIPVNSVLFGDSSGGRRGVSVNRFRFEGDPKWYNIRVGLPDFTTPDDILEAVRREIGEIVANYPRAFGNRGDQPYFIDEVDWIFAERKF